MTEKTDTKTLDDFIDDLMPALCAQVFACEYATIRAHGILPHEAAAAALKITYPAMRLLRASQEQAKEIRKRQAEAKAQGIDLTPEEIAARIVEEIENAS